MMSNWQSQGIRVLCPAKLNTFLAVGPADSSGFHPLRTEFQAIGLFDELTLEPATEDEFVCDIALPERNSVTRAWAMVRELAHLPKLRVTLHKRIPSEAGLGGASSNAAGFLRGVRQWLNLPIEEYVWPDLAVALGADVSFFLVGGRARATGYGEILEPLPDGDECWYVLAKPQIGVGTSAAYGALDRLSYPWRDFPDGDDLYNDFERVAPCECTDLIERLQVAGAEDAGMTGSGSTIFGRHRTRELAEKTAERIQQEHGDTTWVFVAPKISRNATLEVQML